MRERERERTRERENRKRKDRKKGKDRYVERKGDTQTDRRRLAVENKLKKKKDTANLCVRHVIPPCWASIPALTLCWA